MCVASRAIKPAPRLAEAAVPAGIPIHAATSNEKLARLLTLVRQTSAVEGESVVDMHAHQSGVEVTMLAAKPRLRGSGHVLFIRRYDEDRVFAINEWVSFGAERVLVDGDFMDEQLSDIRQALKQTLEVKGEPIMSISWFGRQVMVQTGVQRGPLDGSGHSVTLEQRDGSWLVMSVVAWVS